MQVRLAKVHVPVTALGPGRRVGVWLQGCSLHCHGCLSQDTWDPDAGTTVDVDEVVAAVLSCIDADPTISGVTVSGGEPFEQAAALGLLLTGIRAGTAGREPRVDLLCYSGLSHQRLLKEHADVVGLLDALVPEPFLAGRPADGVWRGSQNQPLLLLTPLAEHRYPAQASEPGQRPFQVMVDEDGIWMIGVPGPGDLDRLSEHLLERGITLEDVSWRQ